MSQPAYYTRYGGTQPPRVGARHATVAPYGPFTASDGKDVLLSVQNEREWAALCERVIGRPELTDDPRFATGSDRVAHRDELDAIIAVRFAELGSEEAMELLDQANIANAGVNSVAEFLDHPALGERDRWREVAVPGTSSPVQALLPPADLSGVSPRMDPVPAAGEHTHSILAELGRGPDDIARLRAAGSAPEPGQATPSPSRTTAFGSPANALPGTMSLPRRLPLPIRTYGRSTTAASTRSCQWAGRPIGVMPPYSMPVSPVAVSIGANEALRAPSWRRTTPFTSTRVEERTRQAASVDSPPRFAGDDHAVRGLLQDVFAVVLHEGGGVGPLRVGVDVDQLLGGDVPAPAAHGVGDGGHQEVEGLGGRADGVEISHGCTHVRTLTAVRTRRLGRLRVRSRRSAQ